jgi:hypothetical protein
MTGAPGAGPAGQRSRRARPGRVSVGRAARSFRYDVGASQGLRARGVRV